MKKGLIVGVALAAFALMFMGVAGASEVSTSGKAEFKIWGTSQGGQVSGLLQKGAVRVDYKVSLTSGPFQTVLQPRFDLPSTLTWNTAYIKWSMDFVNFQMHPLGLKDEFDLWDVSGNAGNPNIPAAHAGVKFEVVPVAPLTFNLGATNVADGGKAKFSYGLSGKYTLDKVTVEGLYGSSKLETYSWYGSYYGVQASIKLAPVELTTQFGRFHPETAGYKDGSGFFAKVVYTLDVGKLTLQYNGADKYFNGKGVATAKEYSKIYGEYEYPLAKSVYLYLDFASIDPGTGVNSYAEYEVKLGVNL